MVKVSLMYLKGTSHHCRWFPKGRECSLVGFFDFDSGGCKSNRKSTSDTCHLIRNCLFFWHIMKQHSDALFTIKVEYVVVVIIVHKSYV